MIYIDPTAIVGDNVILEDDVYIGPYSVIGGHAEYRGKVNERTDQAGAVRIERGTTIREFVTIHGSAMGKETLIGPNCYIQAHAHIGHDACLIGDNVVACHAIVAGFVDMARYAQLGLGAVTHQNAGINTGAFIGASAFFKGYAHEFTIYAGVPAKPIGPNVRLAQRLYEQGQSSMLPHWIYAQLDRTPKG